MNDDHCSYIRNFCRCEKKAWQKFVINPWEHDDEVFLFATAKVAYITAMILIHYNSSLRSSRTWFSYIFIYNFSLLHVYINCGKIFTKSMHLIFLKFSNYFNKYGTSYLSNARSGPWGFWNKIDAPTVYYIIYSSYFALSLYQSYPREIGTADALT